MMLIVSARKAVCYLIFPGFLQKTHAAKFLSSLSLR